MEDFAGESVQAPHLTATNDTEATDIIAPSCMKSDP